MMEPETDDYIEALYESKSDYFLEKAESLVDWSGDYTESFDSLRRHLCVASKEPDTILSLQLESFDSPVSVVRAVRMMLALREEGFITSTLNLNFEIRPQPKNYSDYLGSAEWKNRAWAAKMRAGRRCQVCNSEGLLDTHHRTYERIGHELPEDLIVLCRDCHTLFHKAGKLAR